VTPADGHDVERALSLLRAIAAAPVESGPVALSDEYLAAVAKVEAAASNRDGADKSWIWRAFERDRRHFARARRV
jgi:hypothetical protein